MPIDSYQDGAPTISGFTLGPTYDGVTYDWNVWGTNMTAWAELYSELVGTIKYPDLCWNDITNGSSFIQQKTIHAFLYWNYAAGYFSGWTLYYKNPLTYTRQSVPHIIEGVAGTHIGLTLDTAAFSTAHSYFNSTDELRSAAFFRDPCINIFKALMEQTSQLFLYINNNQELSIDWLNHDPAGLADYTLTDSDINIYRRLHTINDRAFPSSIVYGYYPREYPMSNPKELDWRRAISPSFGNPPINGEYRADHVDDNTGETIGNYISWDDYMILEIEVGHIGFLFDLNNRIAIDNPNLGLSADHVFRIHKIVMHPENMTCDLTLISGVGWNSPI